MKGFQNLGLQAPHNICTHTLGLRNTSVVSNRVLWLTDQGGCTLRPYMSELMHPIVDALMDGASISKREVAVATLGQVVESTG